MCCSFFPLCRWCNLPYDGATWETDDLVGEVIPPETVERFERSLAFPSLKEKGVNAAYTQSNTRPTWKPSQNYNLDSNPVPEFVGGRKLREYQLAGLNWMNWQFAVSRGCILADEMGETYEHMLLVE